MTKPFPDIKVMCFPFLPQRTEWPAETLNTLPESQGHQGKLGAFEMRNPLPVALCAT